LSAVSSPARALDAPDGTRVHDVLVDGAKVGYQLLTFYYRGKDPVVQNEIRIVAAGVARKLAERTLDLLHVGKDFSERYLLRARELWRGGGLTRELWYGKDGLLLRQHYRDKEGELLEFRYRRK